MLFTANANSVTFTGRDGSTSYTASNGAVADMPPSDIGLAFLNNWQPLPLTQWPGQGDLAQDGAFGPISPPSPIKVFQTAIPFIIAPTGTMGNNGAITLGTALSATYPACYLYLPANAIVAGSAAGWYYTVMSSTTVGQVFNAKYNSALISGQPYIPANPIAFATTGPGAYTGVTTAVTGPSFTIPAAMMGPNGLLEVTAMFGYKNSAGNKTCAVTLGSGTAFTVTGTTTAAALALLTIQNQGSASAQVVNQTGTLGTNATAQTYLTQNTNNALTMSMTGQLAAATDYIVMDGISAVVTPG